MSAFKLHRTGGKGEWENIKPSKRNGWQRLAASTHSIVTPGNVLTVSGFALAAYGLVALAHQHYWSGLLIGGLGRFFDIADGFAADRTGTKSPLGESLDAGFDKLATALAIPAIIISKACPWWVIIALAVPQLIITIIGGAHLLRGQRLHPSPAGKLSMLLTWFSLAILVAARALEQPSTGLLSIFGYLIAATAIVLGLKAIIGYLHPRTKR